MRTSSPPTAAPPTAVTPSFDTLEPRRLMSAAPAAAGPAAAALEPGAYDPASILVRFRADAPPGLAGRDVLPGTDVGRSVGLDRSLHRVGLGRGVGVPAALAAYRNHPHVEFAEPNWVYTAQAVSNDPAYTDGSLWGMYGDQTTPANPYGSQAGEAWAKATDAGTSAYTGSKDVYVGVIDEGVDWAHPDLVGNVWTNPFDKAGDPDGDGNPDDDRNGYADDVHGWDFAGNNNSVYDGPADDHGTHVAGTIAAEGGNGAGVAGVAWDVTYIPGKFLGATGGTTADAIEALDYFTDLKTRHGLNVVATNNSWGGGGFSQGLLDAITRAARADILFVAAAGNGGPDDVGDDNDLGGADAYPSNYDTTVGAGYDAVLAVAAIGGDGRLGTFSNYGAATVDLAAPGVGVFSTLPGGGYGYGSGTSMAAPHVTGAAALYAATHPNVSALTIKNAILDAARVAQTAALAGKTTTGGRLDVELALRQSPTPAAPTGLAAAATSSTQIALTWTDNAGNEDGFRIERLDAATGRSEPVGAAGRNATGWSDANLSPDTAYTYQVRADRGADASAPSNPATATTKAPLAAPNAPAQLRATGATTGGISLAWTDTASDETGFTLERSTDAGFPAGLTTRIDVAANSTSYQDAGLAPATAYHYRVRATRTDAATGETSASGYSATLAASTAAPVGTGTGLRGDYYDNMLTEDTRAGYRHLYTLGGWKFARTDATVDANWGTGAPPAPSTKARLAADTFTVRWTGVVQPRYTDDYTFRFEPDDGVGVWVTVDGVRRPLWTPTWDRLDGQPGDGTATEYANTSPHESAPLALRAGARYPIEVVYYEHTGGASARLLWRANTYQPQYAVVPQAQLYHGPTDLTATGVAAGRVDLAWADHAADEGGFKVERSTDGKAWAQVATVGANVTTFSSTGLAAGATYYFRVRAYNATPAFDSAYSNAAVARASAPAIASVFSDALVTADGRDGSADPLA